MNVHCACADRLHCICIAVCVTKCEPFSILKLLEKRRRRRSAECKTDV